MSNLDLKLGLEKAGISVKETAVGDPYVLEGMREGSFSLGGEQSGHVIFADFAITGDGVLTGIQLAAEVSRSGKSLSELACVMTRMPQVLIHVRGVDKLLAATRAIIQDTVSRATAARRGRTRAAQALRDGTCSPGHGRSSRTGRCTTDRRRNS